MATIRLTADLLEHVLDLPPGVVITGARPGLQTIDGVACLVFNVDADDTSFEPWAGDAALALQYEEVEAGLRLVQAIPIE